MRVPLSWLRQYVETPFQVERLAERLTLAGLEVESIEYFGLADPRLAAGTSPAGTVILQNLVWDREKFVVAVIAEVKRHPHTDRLAIATLHDGICEHMVVTGAPNLIGYEGKGLLPTPVKVAYAKEGATIHNVRGRPAKDLTTIERSYVHGVESYSVLCSEWELGISDDHEHIIILDDDAPVGTPLADYIGDVVLEINITANMARNANIVGIAREVSALTSQPFRVHKYDVIACGPSIEGQVQVEIREPDLNPRFTAALIKGVSIRPSPYWMQLRLRFAGMRPINNIVDVTNYVMLELGQPLHAFDYDKLVDRADGHTPQITTRLPLSGERLTTLDGAERLLDSFSILVADTKGALSIGGVMGGAESEVDANTTNVLLEAAAWEFINIRKTVGAQKLQSSEAGYRFSRGVHPSMAERGLKLAIEMMRQVAGGEIAEGIIDVHPRKSEEVAVDLTPAEVSRVLGFPLSIAEITKILESLEFECMVKGGEPSKHQMVGEEQLHTIRVTAPDHRLDIGTGVIGQADLIEEIARVYGYDRIPETQISDTIQLQETSVAVGDEEAIRDILVNLGLQEVITYRLTTPEREESLRPDVASGAQSAYVKLSNPITAERTVLRQSLVASLLEVATGNFRFRDRLTLFEIGPVFFFSESKALPDEPQRLAILMTGPRQRSWWGSGDDTPMDFYDMKGTVDRLISSLNLPALDYSSTNHPAYHPGRCAQIRLPNAVQSHGGTGGTSLIGWIGELHPGVREICSLPQQAILVADIDLEPVVAMMTGRYIMHTLPKSPPLKEDLCVIVDEGLTGSQVQSIIKLAAGDLLADVELFDVYRGEQIGTGKKSLTFSLTYQLEDQTLTDREVLEVRRRIVKQLEFVGAVLR